MTTIAFNIKYIAMHKLEIDNRSLKESDDVIYLFNTNILSPILPLSLRLLICVCPPFTWNKKPVCDLVSGGPKKYLDLLLKNWILVYITFNYVRI